MSRTSDGKFRLVVFFAHERMKEMMNNVSPRMLSIGPEYVAGNVLCLPGLLHDFRSILRHVVLIMFSTEKKKRKENIASCLHCAITRLSDHAAVRMASLTSLPDGDMAGGVLRRLVMKK